MIRSSLDVKCDIFFDSITKVDLNSEATYELLLFAILYTKGYVCVNQGMYGFFANVNLISKGDLCESSLYKVVMLCSIYNVTSSYY